MRTVTAPLLNETSEVVVFSTYSSDGRLGRFTQYHLKAWAAAGYQVVLVLSQDREPERSFKALAANFDGLIVRRVGSAQFGAWADAFRALPSLWSARSVLLVNDAVFGPVHELTALSARLRASAADILALTDSNAFLDHTQTNFVGLQGAALRSPQHRDFWTKVRSDSEPLAALRQYELPFLSLCEFSGLTREVLFPLLTGRTDPTFSNWRDLLLAGFPFIRIDLLQKNRLEGGLTGWQDFVRDPQLLTAIKERLNAEARRFTPMSKSKGSATRLRESASSLFAFSGEVSTGDWFASEPARKYRADIRPLLTQQLARFEATTNPLAAKPPQDTRLLLTVHSLVQGKGTESWVRDVGGALASKGLPVAVYAGQVDNEGQLAKDLRSRGVFVTDVFSEAVRFDPSILHLHHAILMRETETFRSTPSVLNMIHGVLPYAETIRLHQVDAYAAVSASIAAKIHHLTGEPLDAINVLPNAFAPERFARQDPRANHKALIFANPVRQEDTSQMGGLLARTGYQMGFEAWTDTPEKVLPNYEIALGVGRSALEAVASGCKVILYQDGYIGPAVTPRNFNACHYLNFALSSGYFETRHWSEAGALTHLAEQLETIDNASSAAATDLAHSRCTLETTIARLLVAYQGMKQIGR